MNQKTIVKTENKNNEIEEIKKHFTTNAFFFIKPYVNNNALQIAQELLTLENIEEVFIVDGDYGFIAKTKLIDDKLSEEIEQFITKNIKINFHKSHINYKIRKLNKQILIFLINCLYVLVCSCINVACYIFAINKLFHTVMRFLQLLYCKLRKNRP